VRHALKFVFALVGLCAVLVVGWVVLQGAPSDVPMAVVAVLAVVFFSTLPVVLGASSRRADVTRGGQSDQPASESRTRIVVRDLPRPGGSEQPAKTDARSDSGRSGVGTQAS